MTGVRTWVVTVPAPCDFLNSNQRLHRMVEVKLVRAWRTAAMLAARQQLKAARAGRVHIYAHVWKARGGRYDAGNLYPTAKACVDGIVDAGFISDDDHLHVVGPDLRHGGKGSPRLVITIRELPEN